MLVTWTGTAGSGWSDESSGGWRGTGKHSGPYPSNKRYVHREKG